MVHRGEAAALVRDADGTSKLLSWKLGASAAEVLAALPANFEAHALALHPAERSIFVSGRVGQQWQIVAFEPKGGTWHSHLVYSTQYPIRRLLVGPRPFSIGWDQKSATSIVRYRLFFGVKLGDGVFGIRSVTEEGKREYQVIGPKIALPPPVPDSDQPQEITAASALPAAFHPAGNILLWQDQKGCFQQLPYAFEDWDKVAPIKVTQCNGSLTFTPNGTALVQWANGKPGVTIRLGTSKSEQATGYEFVSTPSSTPDGKGLVGLVESAEGTHTEPGSYIPALAEIDSKAANVLANFQMACCNGARPGASCSPSTPADSPVPTPSHYCSSLSATPRLSTTKKVFVRTSTQWASTD